MNTNAPRSRTARLLALLLPTALLGLAPLAEADPGDGYRRDTRSYNSYNDRNGWDYSGRPHHNYNRHHRPPPPPPPPAYGYYRPAPPPPVVIVQPPPPAYYYGRPPPVVYTTPAYPPPRREGGSFTFSYSGKF